MTYGCTLPLFFLRRYPAVLQRLLGKGAQVAVFGVNDRTLQDTGSKPYRKEAAFRQSKDYLPDMVVILIGSNDSKDCNWVSEEAFRQQYRELIAEYRALPSKPRVLICTPPFAYEPANRFLRVLNDAKIEFIPSIANMVTSVAWETGVELVDLFTLTKGRRELLGPDGLHPSAAGAAAIAEAVYQKSLETPPVSASEDLNLGVLVPEASEPESWEPAAWDTKPSESRVWSPEAWESGAWEPDTSKLEGI